VYDVVVRRGAAALAPGGRFAVLDFKRPDRVPAWLVGLGAMLNRPFGVTLDLAERHPWESVARHLCRPVVSEWLHGVAYLAVGEAPRQAGPAATRPAGRCTAHSREGKVAMPVTVTDPVCGMQIEPERAAGAVEFQGVAYYFCSESCRRQFEADPAKYVHADSAQKRRSA
jgi:YHS domain-containing protein